MDLSAAPNTMNKDTLFRPTRPPYSPRQKQFFLSISRNIRFITAAVLTNRKGASLIKALKDIHGIYQKQGV
jgi:hypothetical protein